MRCEFFALQHPNAPSLPNRIANAISEMRRQGSDVIGSPMTTLEGEISVHLPTDSFDAVIPWPTLVVRRSSFLDIGGFSARDSDQDVELVHRAKMSNVRIHRLPFPTVDMKEPWSWPSVGPTPSYKEDAFRSLRHHGVGFPQTHIDCDVVLPIFGQLDFVKKAVQSVIEQEGAEAIVHMIDDCGPENTDSLFDYWRSHPRVRLYRNRHNLGQYASFNNVSEFFETDLAAVQDGDDISLPHRLSISGNLLRSCDADFFAATMEQFGEEAYAEHFSDANRFRRSFHPRGDRPGYFAMNPTVCFRVELFRRLGGYTNYGAPESNRAGLDSEFMTRAYYAGARFAFSTSVVSRYRVHSQAATKNTETGFGSPKRQAALDECRRREDVFCQHGFDPRVFGALRRYQGVTERIK